MSSKKMIERIQTTKQQEKWEKSKQSAVRQLLDADGAMKRQQIDTWAVVDDLGLKVHEFRLLYCIARHENWKTLPGGHKKEFQNGCYASAETLGVITGISRNKIFQVLDLLMKASIIERKERGKKGRNNTSLAGWTYEYRIKPLIDWASPLEIIEIRQSILDKKQKK